MQAVGANVVAVRSGDWETVKGQAVAEDLIREFPNLKALLCGNDNMAIGAINALRQKGKAGKVMVVGYDGIPAVQTFLKDGDMLATVDQFGGQQAVYGIELALKALKEKKAQGELPPIEQTPVKLVTK
jgi:ribose transport system substrate-binding protein